MKKGFTLIELLAVIVILAIVVVIAVPNILSAIKSATRGAFESDAKLVASAINNKKAIDENLNVTSINRNNIDTILGLSNANYDSVTVLNKSDEINIILTGKGKWSGYTAYGSFKDMSIVENTGNGSPLLTSLTTSIGTLVFNTNTFTYNLTVPLDTTSIDITPTIGDSYSLIDINGNLQNSGQAYTYNFATGESSATLNIRVTSITGNEDRSNTYTLNITKGSINVDLTSLSMQSGSTTYDLSPSFSSNQTSYTVYTDASSVTVTPTASDSNSTIRVNGQMVMSNSPSQLIPIPGDLTISVVVSNSGEQKTYTLNVIAANNYALSISVKNGMTPCPLSPGLSHSYLIYDTDVANSRATVAITAEDTTNTDVYINGVLSTSRLVTLSTIGINTVPVSIVEKRSGLTRNYTLRINRTA